MIGYTKISRVEFYRDGAFANPALIRITRAGAWVYYRRTT